MRVFLTVLDSFGIGELADAERFGDKGSNTLKACFKSGRLDIPNMTSLGLYNIDEIDFGKGCASPIGAYGRMLERSNGKDTTVGHWEIAGVISSEPLPTYPNGFPDEVVKEFEEKTGRRVLCNKPYSGTEVIKDYGEEHLKTGALIVYTSADSVFQIASHEEVVPTDELYKYCQIARQILVGKHGVGRVIARPFTGEDKNTFKRTANRRDFSLTPPKPTLLDYMKDSGIDVWGVGKISDIFGGRGLTKSFKTKSNADGINVTKRLIGEDFNGLCFVNLVDFDSVYGHRNNVLGYTEALNYFDKELGEILSKLRKDDLFIITADHGCDPSTPSTDHSRESVPLLIYGRGVKDINLGIKDSFSDLAKTIADLFGIENSLDGKSFKKDITL
ncbi:MAG: phosphopentomutase [Clostridia bacterium]|nr:phosphopentomutase [Clostridia bacterium]